jgi:hypothetical protein
MSWASQIVITRRSAVLSILTSKVNASTENDYAVCYTGGVGGAAFAGRSHRLLTPEQKMVCAP